MLQIMLKYWNQKFFLNIRLLELEKLLQSTILFHNRR